MFTGFPEPLIQHIQSFLTSKEAAQTTVLSKSCRSAWLTRPNLDFDHTYFHESADYFDPKFLEVADKTLERYDSLNFKIDSFRLRIKIPNRCYYDPAKKLILRALKYGPTRLSFNINASYFYIPNEVFRHESLRSLTVYGWCRVHPKRDEVYRSSLQLLSLEYVFIESHATISHLVSSCPLIEKLSLCHVDVYRSQQTIISPLHWLKSLVLKDVSFDYLFLADLSIKFPSLKVLTLHINQDHKEMLISSPTLQRLEFNMGYCYEIQRVELDVPSIRKLTFVCSSAPDEFSLKSKSRGWESCVSVTPSKCLGASWFYKLSNFLQELRLSRIFLSLHVSSRATFDYKGGQIHDLPMPEIENLKIYHMHLPSLICYALFDGLFLMCRPKLITQYMSCDECHVCSSGFPTTDNNNYFLWERLLEARDAKVPIPNYQFMYSLNDLKEARVQVFDAAVSTTWRDVTLESYDNSTTWVKQFIIPPSGTKDAAPMPSFLVFWAHSCIAYREHLIISRSRESIPEPMPMPTDLGIKYVTLRLKTPIGEEGASIAELPQEEAICEICCRLIEEDTSVLSTACGCSSILTHENCRHGQIKAYKKCDGCDQVFQHTPVTVSRNNIETPTDSTKRSGGWLPKLFRRKRKQ